jgi:hypothetical protein
MFSFRPVFSPRGLIAVCHREKSIQPAAVDRRCIVAVFSLRIAAEPAATGSNGTKQDETGRNGL